MPPVIEKQIIAETVESIQADFWKISDKIWGYAELGLVEFKSAKLLADTLETAGFQVDRGVAGMPTAFVATWTSGAEGPVIGLTAEFDALPNLSQKAGSPFHEPRVAGGPGHGCGHNTMGAMQALAAVALQETARCNKLDVTIKYFGSPAEELGVSRPLMVREGLFEGIDAIIDCHADSLFKTTYGMLGTALKSFLVTFNGKSAHAGWKPWLGRSAADAVELMHAGTERMREHMPLTNRIHWVTTASGGSPNTVPDDATTWYYVRALEENLEQAVSWVLDCARGAALMTQTNFDIKVLSAIHQRFYNPTLARVLYENIKTIGIPRYTPEEDAFARALQKEAGFEEKGLDFQMALVNAEEDEFRASSSDMGDVCLVVPTGQVSIPVWIPGSPAHHWTVTSASGTSIAHKGISTAAKAVVFTVVDILTRPEWLPRIKADFAELKRRYPYRSFLPPAYKPPLDFYAETTGCPKG